MQVLFNNIVSIFRYATVLYYVINTATISEFIRLDYNTYIIPSIIDPHLVVV